MSLSGFVVFAVGIWATYASVRTIQRIGLRRFSVAVGRLCWDLGKVAVGGMAVVGGAVAASAPNPTDDDAPDPLDPFDPDNYTVRPDSPLRWTEND